MSSWAHDSVAEYNAACALVESLTRGTSEYKSAVKKAISIFNREAFAIIEKEREANTMIALTLLKHTSI